MSLKVLEAVRNAEQRGADIIRKAKEEAGNTVAEASEAAENIRKQYIVEAAEERSALLKQAEKDGINAAAIIASETEACSTEIRNIASERKAAASAIVIKKLIDTGYTD